MDERKKLDRIEYLFKRRNSFSNYRPNAHTIKVLLKKVDNEYVGNLPTYEAIILPDNSFLNHPEIVHQ